MKYYGLTTHDDEPSLVLYREGLSALERVRCIGTFESYHAAVHYAMVDSRGDGGCFIFWQHNPDDLFVYKHKVYLVIGRIWMAGQCARCSTAIQEMHTAAALMGEGFREPPSPHSGREVIQ